MLGPYKIDVGEAKSANRDPISGVDFGAQNEVDFGAQNESNLSQLSMPI